MGLEDEDEAYRARLLKYDEHPGLLWDPVDEEWVDDPNYGGYGNSNLGQQIIIVPPSNGMATAGLILGIISMGTSLISPLFLFSCCLLSVPMAVLGAIFSHIGYSQSRTFEVGRGAAVSGLVLNWLQILMTIPTLVFMMLNVMLSSGGA